MCETQSSSLPSMVQTLTCSLPADSNSHHATTRIQPTHTLIDEPLPSPLMVQAEAHHRPLSPLPCAACMPYLSMICPWPSAQLCHHSTRGNVAGAHSSNQWRSFEVTASMAGCTIGQAASGSHRSRLTRTLSTLYAHAPLGNPYLVTSHLASPHLTSSRLTSPHLTSPHLTSPHLASPRLTSPRLSSGHTLDQRLEDVCVDLRGPCALRCLLRVLREPLLLCG